MSFELTMGQERAKAVLRAGLASQRLPGAYLFVGPPGVGKRFTAKQFVKAINCLSPGSDGSCDRCAHCRLVEKGEFPDLYAPEAHGGKLTKRAAADGDRMALEDILPRLHFAPVMGRYKVVILDPADGLTAEAGNMLLKTVEEPPSRTLFILVATVETSVLPTLVSRCQKVRFTPLSAEQVADFLQRQRTLAPELAATVAAASQGSIERALDLCQSRLLEQRAELLDFLLALFDSRLSERTVMSLSLLQSSKAERELLERVRAVGRMLSRDLLQASAGMDRSGWLLADRGREIERLAGQLGRQGVLQLWEVLDEFSRGVERNENPKSLLHFLGNRLRGLAAGSAA
ncbi:MAG: DNA polymerase III subunit [Deltaproteobacteria bacterium]|nr:DNA polymerase III subunit [Deltaproteobacteria bacterium]